MFKKNAGRYFEEWIEVSNAQYNARGKAVITKIPTPWQVQRKYNPYKKTYEIATAFPVQKSTVDFGGTASKLSLWFEAKTTTNKTSFPLVNIHKHQIDYLRSVDAQGGKAFLLIYSDFMDRTWLLWINQLLDFMATEKRKSIPFVWLDMNCPVIKPNNGIALDYLPEALKSRKD